MVDFKYHVVSIVAVFLALALGIVLGTNVLSGDVLDNLKTQTSQLRKQAQDLRGQIDDQQAQLAHSQAFEGALEPIAVAGRLTGRDVVIVSLPGASKDVRDGLAKALGYAGATLTAEVDVDGSFVDQQQAAALDALSSSLAEPTVDLRAAKDPAGRAAAVLAAALVAPPAPSAGNGTALAGDAGRLATSPTPAATATATAGPTPTATATPTSTATPRPPEQAAAPPPAPAAGGSDVTAAATAALAGFEKAGFVSLDGEPDAFAGLAVVVTATPSGGSASPSAGADAALLELVSALASAGAQTVVAGPVGSTESGGFVGELRGSAQLARKVSGVDDADTAAGRIAVVLALEAQLLGKAGQYGTGQGATAPLPSPA